MSCGQVLFKASALRLRESGSVWALFWSPHFISAVVLYAALTVVWVYILTGLQLSVAYPFVALSFVFTPLGAYLIFGETISGNYIVGLTLIVGGLIALVR
jgi:drug/metabolite transporter (DMT)-like permease